MPGDNVSATPKKQTPAATAPLRPPTATEQQLLDAAQATRKDILNAALPLIQQLVQGITNKDPAVTQNPRGTKTGVPGLEATKRAVVSELGFYPNTYDTSDPHDKLIYYEGLKAAPGLGNHTGGIAMDFTVEQGGTVYGQDSKKNDEWAASWFHGWLVAHAAEFSFKPIATEAWHWEYHP